MARDYGKISTSVWRSKRFKSMPSSYCPRLFYLYLHTCSHVNSTGCFWLPKGYINTDLKWSNRDIDRAISTCIESGLIAYDDDEEVVYIERFLEHSPITNAKHALGALKQAEMLPSSPLKSRIIKDLLSSKWCSGLNGLERYKAESDRCFDTPIDTTETEPETDKEKNNKKNSDKILSEEFSDWWSEVPTKKSKGAAETAYLKARREASAETLLSAIKLYAASVRGKEEQYIKHPSTWLNKKCWLDETPAEATARVDPEITKWRVRLWLAGKDRWWMPGDDWNGFWGKEPHEGNPNIPKAIYAEWRAAYDEWRQAKGVAA